MPERQSSPGEVTAGPDTDRTDNGEASAGAPQQDATPTGGDPAGVAEQVADQVAAEPEATEPAPAEPGEQPPVAAAPVADAAEITRGSVADPAGTGDAGATAAPEAPATGTTAGARVAPEQEPAAAAPVPEPESEPATGSGPAPRPRPRPRPAAVEVSSVETPARQAPPEQAPVQQAPPEQAPARQAPAAEVPADESPTVSTVVGDGPTVSMRSERPIPPSPTAPSPTRPSPTRPRPTPTARAVHEQPTTAVTAAAAVPAAASARTESETEPQTWDAEATQVIPRTPTPTDRVRGDQPTERLPVTPAAPPPVPPHRPDADESDGSGPGRSGRGKRPLLIVAGVVALLALIYVGDLLLSSGSVPRGVTVAGVRVGGLGMDEAEQRLRSEIEPRSTQPVAVTVGEARSEIDPTAAGLAVDWRGTLDRAGSQPLNPITRITSFFTEREVGVATTSDREALDAALAQLAPIVDKAPVEGSVQFDGSRPVPVDPVPGQELNLPGAADVLQREWASGASVALPLIVLPPTTTPEDVATAIEQVARPALAGPVTVTGEGGAVGTISPDVIAAALTFRPEPDGGLVPEINPTPVTEALAPQLASSERPGRDAALDFSSGSAVVIPSQDGRGIDYEATLKDLLTVLTGDGPRDITAVYADQPAELTTEELNALGISGMISEFTTGGFAADSGLNIKRAAEQINGMIVQPGETFSLNAATLPRDAANGYVEAGIISDGHPSRGIGGGVSQVATTLYNAAYFAGMVDVAHREHSFYISRYPAGREATVYDDKIDVKFRNDNPTAVMIQTEWTPQSLTVRMFGTKRYEVTSESGPRTNPTDPTTVTIPAGEPCSPSRGAPGFTITDTRTLREISTGEVRTETRTVRYNPSPIVICEG